MVIGATHNMVTDLSVWVDSSWALTTDGTHNSWKDKIVVRQWHGYRNDTVTKWKIDSTKYLLTYWVEFDFSFLVLSFSNFVYLIHQTKFVTIMIKLLHQKSQEWRISNNPTAHSVFPPYLSRPNSPTSFIFWVVLFFSYAICDDFFQENNLS